MINNNEKFLSFLIKNCKLDKLDLFKIALSKEKKREFNRKEFIEQWFNTIRGLLN